MSPLEGGPQSHNINGFVDHKLLRCDQFPEIMAAAKDSGVTAYPLGEAFTKGKFGYSFRWRLENVDQDPLPHDATAMHHYVHASTFHTADLVWVGQPRPSLTTMFSPWC